MCCPPSVEALNEVRSFNPEKEEGLALEGFPLIDLIQNVVSRGSSLRLRAKGCSMAPFIKDGDVLTLSPPVIRSLGIGDVVAFSFPQSGRLIIHRVIRAFGGDFLIRGDYCAEPDGVIPKQDILAVVSRVERNGRKVSLGLGTERAIIAFLSARAALFPLLSFLYRWSWKILR